MAPLIVEVEGHTEIPHHAERALIHVSVASTGTNKAAVSDEVLTTTKHIENLLKDLSPADETQAAKVAAPLAHWSKNSMSATSWQPWDHTEQVYKARQYTTKVTFDIRFKKFKELGEFGSRLSALEHTEVTNIEWILTAATEKSYRSQLRKAAAQDALQKAQDYCETLGCTNVRAVKLEETHGAHRISAMNPQAMGHSIQQMQMQQMQLEQMNKQRMQAASGNLGSNDHRDGGVLEFRPQEVRMSMSVNVKFHADNGSLANDHPAKRVRSADDEMSE